MEHAKNKTVDLNLVMSIVTLDVNGLTPPAKEILSVY